MTAACGAPRPRPPGPGSPRSGTTPSGCVRMSSSSVHQAFYRVLAADAALAAAGRTGRAEHLRLAEIRKAAGAVPQADVLRARVEVADLAWRSSVPKVSCAPHRVLNTAMGLPAARPVDGSAGGRLRGGEPRSGRRCSRALRQRPELAATKEGESPPPTSRPPLSPPFGPRVRAEIGVGRRIPVSCRKTRTGRSASRCRSRSSRASRRRIAWSARGEGRCWRPSRRVADQIGGRSGRDDRARQRRGGGAAGDGDQQRG